MAQKCFLVVWQISMEVMNQVDREEERILMALSQAYLEWERQMFYGEVKIDADNRYHAVPRTRPSEE
jgi:hypothetical protein